MLKKKTMWSQVNIGCDVVGSACCVHMIPHVNNFLSFSFWKKSKDLMSLHVEEPYCTCKFN